MNISPQQRIWIEIRMICVDLGYKTYDYLPGERAGYPFVMIGEQFKQDVRQHKDYLNGQTQVTVHVWGNDWRRRGTINDMMNNIEMSVRQRFKHDVASVNTQTLNDNSTGSNLIHGVLEFNILY